MSEEQSKDHLSMADEEYEILPHKEVQELKEQLHQLKSFDVAPTKRLTVNLVELNTKIEKLLGIFEEAGRQISVEEGGLTFQEKMKPIFEKMNKILEQNSEIAEGIVAVADMVKEFRADLENKGILVREKMESPPFFGAVPVAPPPMPPRRPAGL